MNYEQVINEIDYLINDSKIDDRVIIDRLKSFLSIMQTNKLYKTRIGQIENSDIIGMIENEIDIQLNELKKEKERIILKNSQYYPYCGSKSLDSIVYSIKNLKELKGRVRTLLYEYVAKKCNYDLNLQNQLSCQCYEDIIDSKDFHENYYFGQIIYSDTNIHVNVLNKIMSILINKKLIGELSKIINLDCDIRSTRENVENLELLKKNFDLISEEIKLEKKVSAYVTTMLDLTSKLEGKLTVKMENLSSNKLKKHIFRKEISKLKIKIDKLKLKIDKMYEMMMVEHNKMTNIIATLTNEGINVSKINDSYTSKSKIESDYESQSSLLNNLLKQKEECMNNLSSQAITLIENEYCTIKNIVLNIDNSQSSKINFYIIYVLSMINNINCEQQELELPKITEEEYKSYFKGQINEIISNNSKKVLINK